MQYAYVRSFRPICVFRSLPLLALAFIALAASAVSAHHSYVTKYDPQQVVTVSGVISSVSFRNPHIFFELTATTKGGGTTNWEVETESIPKVQAKGLTQSLLAVGKSARVTGWLARDKSAKIGLKSIRIGSKTISIRRTPR